VSFILIYSKPNKLIPTHQYEHERCVLIYLVMLMVFMLGDLWIAFVFFMQELNNNSIWSWEIETNEYGDEKKWNNKKKLVYILDWTFIIIMHAQNAVFLSFLIVIGVRNMSIPTIKTKLMSVMPYGWRQDSKLSMKGVCWSTLSCWWYLC
jgi:hypothetical protein